MIVSSKKHSVRKMKEKTIEMMEDLCNSRVIKRAELTYRDITDKHIEEKNFLVERHSTEVRKFCNRKRVHVSFREAGKFTLERIKNGNPCKGHDILDKTIKQKKGEWIYKSDEKTLKNYRGLVGYSEDENELKLDAIWGLDEKGRNKVKYSLEELENKIIDIESLFTGDYDMHDLLKNNKRVLAGTPEELSIISGLVYAMMNKNNNRRKKVSLRSFSGRRFKSPYALIRHGAQTSYISYLLLGKNKSELKKFNEKGVPFRQLSQDETSATIDKTNATIDKPIVMFDPQGDAYLLDSVPKVYSYYKNEGLIDQIPFYFFFPYLMEMKMKQYKDFKKLMEYYDYLYDLYGSILNTNPK